MKRKYYLFIVVVVTAMVLLVGCENVKSDASRETSIATSDGTIALAQTSDLKEKIILKNEDYESLVAKYDWARCNGELLRKEDTYEPYNAKMIGPLFFLTLIDINGDGIPEIIKSHKYTERTVQLNEVYTIFNEEIKYIGWFIGAIEDIKIYKDTNNGEMLFNTYSHLYQELTTTNSIFECRYNSDLSKFIWKKLFAEKENFEGDKYYFKYRDEIYDASIISCWNFSLHDERFIEESTEIEYKSENDYLNVLKGYCNLLEIEIQPVYVSSEKIVGDTSTNEFEEPLSFTSQEKICEIVYSLFEQYYEVMQI